jgi:GTPase SAR1 family protein
MDYIQKSKSDGTPVFKIVVAGNSGVGKTTFVNAFVQLMKYNHNIKSKSSIVEGITRVKSPTTIACDLNVVDIDIRADYLTTQGGSYTERRSGDTTTNTIGSNESTEKTIKLHIYDTAGAEAFHAITLSYFRGAHCVMLFFDLNDMRTLQQVVNWKKTINRLDSLETDSGPPCVFILIGTKLDGCFSYEETFTNLTAYIDSMSQSMCRDTEDERTSSTTTFPLNNIKLQYRKFRETHQCLYVNVEPNKKNKKNNNYNTTYEIQKHQSQRHLPALREREETEPLLSYRESSSLGVTVPKQWSKFVVGSIYEKFTQITESSSIVSKDHIIIDLLRQMILFKNNRPIELSKSPSEDSTIIQMSSSIHNIQLISEIMLQDQDFLFVPFTSANRGYNVIETMELIVKHLCHVNRTFITKNDKLNELDNTIVLGETPPTGGTEKIKYTGKCCV